jgi:competence ComEA-like helix-hairpin-helix protein
MTPERRAVLTLLALAVCGHGARAAWAHRDRPPGSIELLGARTANAALARRDSLALLVAPLGPGERIDPDRATAAELARLPGIGPGLARRLVAHREAHGPFGSLEGVDAVPGVGEALLGRIAPHLAFAGRPAALPDTSRPRRARRGVAEGAAPGPAGPRAPRYGAPPGILSGGPPPPGSPPPATGPAAPEVLNRGTVADLDRLPGIGPSRARRIVAYRDSAGPFGGPEALARVPGISLALATRLWNGAGRP